MERVKIVANLVFSNLEHIIVRGIEATTGLLLFRRVKKQDFELTVIYIRLTVA